MKPTTRDSEGAKRGTEAKTPHERVARMMRWLPFALCLAWLYGGALLEHMRRAADPLRFTDDVRHQTYAFFRYSDPELFPNDYASDYHLHAFFPLGYRALFTLGAFVWDAAALSKVLPYVLLAVVCVAIWLIAARIGHRASGWFALALALGSGAFLSRIAGGLPRAFGFPVLALAVCVLVYGRIRWAVVMVWIGAAFYPVAGAIAGLMLTLVLLALPANHRGEAASWSLKTRVLVLALAAGVSVLIMLPTVIGGAHYGRLLTAADHAQYPEAGPRGRLRGRNAPPWDSYPVAAAEWAQHVLAAEARPLAKRVHKALLGRKAKSRPWFWTGLGLLSAAGWWSLLRRSRAARVFSMLAVASVLGYIAARPLTPYLYLPPRYVMYPIPLLCAVGVPVAFFELGRLAAERLRRAPLAMVVGVLLCGMLLLVAGTRMDTHVGMLSNVNGMRPLWYAIGALPKDAMIAGWPKGVMDSVPYVTRRQALLTYETHQVYHEGYVREMRRRANALIAAYFAASPEPIAKLRNEFGVTHMVVDANHYRKPPTYFVPFRRKIKRAFRDNRGHFYLISPAVERAVIYRRLNMSLLDLARLP